MAGKVLRFVVTRGGCAGIFDGYAYLIYTRFRRLV